MKASMVSLTGAAAEGAGNWGGGFRGACPSVWNLEPSGSMRGPEWDEDEDGGCCC